MPIEDFSGETFVAFTDISGFKEMMKDKRRVMTVIDQFYSAGYDCLHSAPDINGLFVSDCGILFSRASSSTCRLRGLLAVVEELNRTLLIQDIMLTTSIAFGQFSYHQRLEFHGIEKNLLYGNAYLSAFLDNETGFPRIQPGQCRIVLDGVNAEELANIPRLDRQRKHCYYYWMVNSTDEVAEFNKRYSDSYQLKYSGMLEALKWKGQQ